METPKAIRRAQISLLKKAEVEAGERKIALTDAMLEIIERADDPQTIIRAFTRLPVSQSQSSPEKAEMESYFDAAC